MKTEAVLTWKPQDPCCEWRIECLVRKQFNIQWMAFQINNHQQAPGSDWSRKPQIVIKNIRVSQSEQWNVLSIVLSLFVETVVSVGCQRSSSDVPRKVISANFSQFLPLIAVIKYTWSVWGCFEVTAVYEYTKSLALAKKLITVVDEVCGGIDDSDTIEMTTDTLCEAASGQCSQPRAGVNNTILVPTYFTASRACRLTTNFSIFESEGLFWELLGWSPLLDHATILWTKN